MSSYLEQRDGYGWTLGADLAVAADKNGAFVELKSGNPANTLTKTIFNHQLRTSPAFVSKTFRIYNVTGSAATVTAVVTHMKPYDDGETITASVPANGYADIHIDGFITGADNPTIAFTGAASTFHIYLLKESGY